MMFTYVCSRTPVSIRWISNEVNTHNVVPSVGYKKLIGLNYELDLQSLYWSTHIAHVSWISLFISFRSPCIGLRVFNLRSSPSDSVHEYIWIQCAQRSNWFFITCRELSTYSNNNGNDYRDDVVDGDCMWINAIINSQWRMPISEIDSYWRIARVYRAPHTVWVAGCRLCELRANGYTPCVVLCEM